MEYDIKNLPYYTDVFESNAGNLCPRCNSETSTVVSKGGVVNKIIAIYCKECDWVSKSTRSKTCVSCYQSFRYDFDSEPGIHCKECKEGTKSKLKLTNLRNEN